MNFHHIDGDNSNTVDENLAVLCLKDHDAHHRPDVYLGFNHLELKAEQIKEFKNSWENFVAEASKSDPEIFAVINVYGSEIHIHSIRLIFQWSDGRIVFERIYHLLDGPIESWIERAFDEVSWLGEKIRIFLINKPLEVEYCPSCASSFGYTVDRNWAIKLTSQNWHLDSICSIYVNPINPSLAMVVALDGEILYQSHLHRCHNCLHYICEKYEERVPLIADTNVRIQAKRIAERIINEWQPSRVIIGKGDPDAPELISDLDLPESWETN